MRSHAFQKFMMQMIMPCKDVSHLASQAMDHTLPFVQRVRLKIHLSLCMLCRQCSEHILFIRDALRRYGERLEQHDQDASSHLSPESRERIRQALRRSSI